MSYARAHTHTHMHTHVHTHMRMHTHIRTYTCTYTQSAYYWLTFKSCRILEVTKLYKLLLLHCAGEYEVVLYIDNVEAKYVI